jgi:hypothetical protein
MRVQLVFIAASSLWTLPAILAVDFTVPDGDLTKPVSVIAYGDMRFTDRSNTESTNPKVRKWLVDKIAHERPQALLLSGDVPWHGGEKNDYAVYRQETASWREEKLRVFPTLGNHELNGDEHECLEDWWSAFPQLRGRRWYSVQLGNAVYILNLDSNSSLLPSSEQDKWLVRELSALSQSVKFVFFNLHHPPVSDFQVDGDPSHNARPNEIALADRLKTCPQRGEKQFIVTAGHVHNYERFLKDGIEYLVSGGGGAKPRPIVRTKDDLYRSSDFPNYHYLKFVVDGSRLLGTMMRVADPSAASPSWQEAESFSLPSGESAQCN